MFNQLEDLMYTNRTDYQSYIARGRIAAVIIVIVSLVSIAANVALFLNWSWRITVNMNQALSNAQELAKLTNDHYVVLECTGGYFPSSHAYYSQHHYTRRVVLQVMPNGNYTTHDPKQA